MDTLTAYDLFYSIRSRAKIDDGKCAERVANANPDERPYECFDDYCLFDVQQDPCEYRNVAEQNRQALAMTVDMLEQFKTEMIEQIIPKIDPNADPRLFDGYWETWMELGNGADPLTSGYSACAMIIVACALNRIFSRFYYNA